MSTERDTAPGIGTNQTFVVVEVETCPYCTCVMATVIDGPAGRTGLVCGAMASIRVAISADEYISST